MDNHVLHSRMFDKLVHNKEQFIKVPKSLEFVFNESYELLGDSDGSDIWFNAVRENGWLS